MPIWVRFWPVHPHPTAPQWFVRKLAERIMPIPSIVVPAFQVRRWLLEVKLESFWECWDPPWLRLWDYHSLKSVRILKAVRQLLTSPDSYNSVDGNKDGVSTCSKCSYLNRSGGTLFSCGACSPGYFGATSGLLDCTGEGGEYFFLLVFCANTSDTVECASKCLDSHFVSKACDTTDITCSLCEGILRKKGNGVKCGTCM